MKKLLLFLFTIFTIVANGQHVRVNQIKSPGQPEGKIVVTDGATQKLKIGSIKIDSLWTKAQITPSDTARWGSSTGTVTNVTATSPIFSSGGSQPNISIQAATSTQTGSMSASDKAKLDSDTDQSPLNEIQTVSNTSDATSHTVTLSNSGGSVKFIEGAGIGISSGGTTINGEVTIQNTGVVTEVDGSITNEGLLGLSSSSNSATITSNTSGSTSITIKGGGINQVSVSGNDITITGTEVDGSTTNELQTISTNGNPGNISLSNSGGTLNLNVNDADSSTTNELNISANYDKSTHIFSITDAGGSVGDTIPISTTIIDGLMSASDKAKFDSIMNGTKPILNIGVKETTTIKYGYLYNWYAATDIRDIANTGWHVPSYNEWVTLITYLGGNSITGGKLKEIGITHWMSNNEGATNEVGFNLRGAGDRYNGEFELLKEYCYLITTTTFNDWFFNENGYYPDPLMDRYMAFGVTNTSANIASSNNPYDDAATIRLIKNSTTLTNGQVGAYTGNDGKVYRTICIGNQEWISDNLAETKYRNGDAIPEVTDNTAWVALTTGARCSYNNDETNAFTTVQEGNRVALGGTLYFDETIIGDGTASNTIRVDTTRIATVDKLKYYRLLSDHDSLSQLQERSYNSLTDKPDLSVYKLKTDSTALSGYFTNYKALSKVPYTGATANVDLGNYSIAATGQTLPIFNGACQISSITDNGNGSITLGSGDYHLSSLATGKGTKKYTLSGGTFTLTDLAQNYIVADYNSGSPLIKVITDVSLINETTVIPIYSIFRNGTVLHIQNWDSLGLALANKVHQSIVKTQRYRRDQTIGGLLLTESGTRNLNLSIGRVWVGAVPVDISAIASATDNIYFWYHSSGVWTSSVITQYPNTQYDNGTNLATLTVNRYAVCWIYRGIESQKHLYLVVGTGDYTLAQAEAASQPAIPTAISSHAMLVAKLIVQNGANTATSIQSAFDTQFSLSTVQSHQDLINRDAVDTHPASSITNTPAGNVASTNVQTAINELDTEKKITNISFTSSAITTTQGDGTTASASVPTFNQSTTGQAGYVANSQTIKFDTGITEGTDLYTFNGSAAKTIDIKAGTNITLTKAAGSITIASTATGGTTGIWTSLTGTYANATTFTFSGTDTDAKLVEMSLLTCTNSTGATRRIGYVKTATNSSGTITCNVITDTDLASGDKDFKIAYNQKIIFKPVTIPGEIIADASYSQGMFYYTSTASYLLPIDIIVRTPASGTGASCTVQVYKNATSLFSSAPDLSTNNTLLSQRPTTNTISAGDIISVRIPASAGATNKAADMQVLLPIIQQSIFTAF